MDIVCITCHEPWDHYHLRHDAVHDAVAAFLGAAGYSESFAKRFTGKLGNQAMRRKTGERVTWEQVFEADGWKFASGSLYAVVRCPACPANAPAPSPEEMDAVGLLAALSAGDEDAACVDLADYHQLRRSLARRSEVEEFDLVARDGGSDWVIDARTAQGNQWLAQKTCERSDLGSIYRVAHFAALDLIRDARASGLRVEVS